MNKKVAIIAVLALASHLLFAQDEGGAKKFRFGLKAAPSLSWMKPDLKSIEKKGMTLGFNYGLMMDFALSGNGNYAFATGIEVSSIGGKLEYPNVVIQDSLDYYGTTLRNFKLKYINLPLQLKLKTNEIGYMTYFGSFGIDAAFKFKSKATDEHTLRKKQSGDVDPPLTPVDEDIEINKDVSFFRVALVLGAGFEYNLSGNTSFMVGVTFNNGFNNVLTYDGYELSSSYSGPDLDKSNKAKDANQKMNAISNYLALNVGIFF